MAATAISDASGAFRFVGLRPGKYDVTGKLQGFTPAQVKAIDLRLGQILTADLALSVGGVTETVSVTAESPIIDTKQSARQTSIKDEQFELLPKGRDFTSLVTQAAGANSEAKLGGLSIDGASAGENRFIIDGVETTNLQNGTSGKNLIVDFVEEVQVKSSGYTAEFGGATGRRRSTWSPRAAPTLSTARPVYIGEGRLGLGQPAAPPDAADATDATRASPSTSRIRRTTTTASSPASRWAARLSRIGCGSSAASSRR